MNVKYSGIAVRKDRILDSIKCLYSELKVLALSTKNSVQVNRMRSRDADKEFQKARADLREANAELQSVRRDLQYLYVRKTNEYLKPRELQSIREINEEENAMIDRERAAVTRVEEIQSREENFFELFRSSNDALYQSTQRYANKFIVFGVLGGLVFGVWRTVTFINAPSPSTSTTNDDASTRTLTVHHDDALLQVIISKQTEQSRDLDNLKAQSCLHETSFKEVNANLVHSHNLIYGVIALSIVVLSIGLIKLK